MKLAVIVGTRPEIIKMSPIIRHLQKEKVDFCLIHTNQHYSSNMDRIFFEELLLPAPHFNLNVGSGSHGIQTARILEKIEPILDNEGIDCVLVQGDTNTVLAAALAASKMQIKVAHIEAGLRSYDTSMPEEKNRVLTDHLSNYLFAVSQTQKENLLREGISSEKIFIVGNTIVDALIYAQNQHQPTNPIQQEYYLATLHRPSNVDSLEGLSEVVKILKNLNHKVVWPIHPRTKANIKRFDIKLPTNLLILEPQGYFDFIHLMANAKLILTDSGGIQEEACILQVPCVTLRSNTERPESVDVGANKLVGREWEKIKSALTYFSKKTSDWPNPFGDGRSADKIINVLK